MEADGSPSLLPHNSVILLYTRCCVPKSVTPKLRNKRAYLSDITDRHDWEGHQTCLSGPIQWTPGRFAPRILQWYRGSDLMNIKQATPGGIFTCMPAGMFFWSRELAPAPGFQYLTWLWATSHWGASCYFSRPLPKLLGHHKRVDWCSPPQLGIDGQGAESITKTGTNRTLKHGISISQAYQKVQTWFETPSTKYIHILLGNSGIE